MPRRSRSVAGLCIAVIGLAAFFPGIGLFDHALFELQWVLLPDVTLVAVCITAAPRNEQPAPFQSLLPSRAPPLRPLA
jgi:hypothetical protein